MCARAPWSALLHASSSGKRRLNTAGYVSTCMQFVQCIKSHNGQVSETSRRAGVLQQSQDSTSLRQLKHSLVKEERRHAAA